MRTYLRVRDVTPPDAFQPPSELTFVDLDGSEVNVNFLTPEAMENTARVLQDAAWEFRQAMTRHFEQARDFDDTRRDDYEWPEEVAS